MKSKRITSGILAVLAATVVACGSIQGAAGKADPAQGGGTVYLAADDNYGIGLSHAVNAGGPTGALSDASGGPSLQP